MDRHIWLAIHTVTTCPIVPQLWTVHQKRFNWGNLSARWHQANSPHLWQENHSPSTKLTLMTNSTTNYSRAYQIFKMKHNSIKIQGALSSKKWLHIRIIVLLADQVNILPTLVMSVQTNRLRMNSVTQWTMNIRCHLRRFLRATKTPQNWTTWIHSTKRFLSVDCLIILRRTTSVNTSYNLDQWMIVW